MSNADDEIQCPHCEKTLRRRDLHAVTVQTCRSCGGIVEQKEQWECRDDEAITQEDVSAVDAWLDSVARVAGLQVQRVSDGESMGEFLWSIQGLPVPWQCEALYQRSRPEVVLVRLRAEVSAPEALPDRNAVEAACVARGVQPEGERIVQSVGQSTAHTWWGAAQFLGTSWLPPDLFRPVVDRLAEVLREVAPHVPPG
jgi:hypothetical protein